MIVTRLERVLKPHRSLKRKRGVLETYYTYWSSLALQASIIAKNRILKRPLVLHLIRSCRSSFPGRHDPSTARKGRPTNKNNRNKVLVAVASCLALLGCEREAETKHRRNRRVDTQVTGSKRDDLNKAMELLEGIDQYEPTVARRQAQLALVRWIAKQPSEKEWAEDAFVEQLPKYLASVKRRSGLADLQFKDDDVYYLQEHVFLRDISRFVSQRDGADPLIQKWLASTDDEELQDLSVAIRLFDWTVRTIQLDPSRPLRRQSRETIGPAPAAEAQKKDEIKAPPPLEPGPGGIFHPWETLLKGHGDELDRARIFILLARQQGIPVVMLALEDSEYLEPNPWLPAVLIRDQLYLFDMTLGLPIPRLDQTGIATLEYILSTPDALCALDTEEQDYPVQSADVRRNVVLIEASPKALSRRMCMVERRLAGDRRMVLTTQPSLLDKRLRQCAGVGDVRIWSLSFEVERFRSALRKKWNAEEDGPDPVVREMQLISNVPPLLRGRVLQFRGQFNDSGQQAGATSLYLSCRLPDAVIRKIATDPTMQRQLGLHEVPRQALKSRVQFMVAGKQTASYWLGQIHFESGDYEVARNDYETRTLKASPNGPWRHGGRYNLGRTWELLGEIAQAKQVYAADDSPQRHGNQLRARFLERLE